MAEKVKYQGHVIQIEALHTDGDWNWQYSIDGGLAVKNPASPLPSRDMALAEATRAACYEIDGMSAKPAGEMQSSPETFRRSPA